MSMGLAIVGYGKMGRMIEQFAPAARLVPQVFVWANSPEFPPEMRMLTL